MEPQNGQPKKSKKWYIIGGIIAVVILISVFGKSNDKKEEKKSEAPIVAAAPSTPAVNIPGYSYFDFEKRTQGGRLRVQARIVPVSNENINEKTLAAICLGAAKHFAEENSAKVSSVFVMDQKADQWAMQILATCHYSPDNGGFSGDQKWTWNNVTAAERTTTDAEKRISIAWAEMRGQYQKNGLTDEDALKKAIAKKYKMKASDVTLPFLLKENIAMTPELEKTPAIRPVN